MGVKGKLREWCDQCQWSNLNGYDGTEQEGVPDQCLECLEETIDKLVQFKPQPSRFKQMSDELKAYLKMSHADRFAYDKTIYEAELCQCGHPRSEHPYELRCIHNGDGENQQCACIRFKEQESKK